MSPEQAESKSADHRSDLYALGLILYEMVTGDLPFGSDSIMQTMYQRVTQDPKSPQLLNPDVPDYLSEIILRCLKRDPEQRYQHAREILVGPRSWRGTAALKSAPPVIVPPTSICRPMRHLPRPAAGGIRPWCGPSREYWHCLLLVFAVPQSRQLVLGWTRAPRNLQPGFPAMRSSSPSCHSAPSERTLRSTTRLTELWKPFPPSCFN